MPSTPRSPIIGQCPNLGPLISRWEINKFENCWYKSIRILGVLKPLFQQFLNLSTSLRAMSGPILGGLSNSRWSGGRALRKNRKGSDGIGDFIFSLSQQLADSSFYLSRSAGGWWLRHLAQKYSHKSCLKMVLVEKESVTISPFKKGCFCFSFMCFSMSYTIACICESMRLSLPASTNLIHLPTEEQPAADKPEKSKKKLVVSSYVFTIGQVNW